MGTTELKFNFAGDEYIVEAENEKSIKNAIARALPDDINFSEGAITTLGNVVNGDDNVKEIISKTGSSVFELSRRSDQGVNFPEFPPQLSNVTINDSNWDQRWQSEVKFIQMLKRGLSARKQLWFNIDEEIKREGSNLVIHGWNILPGYGIDPFEIIIDRAYPLICPEISFPYLTEEYIKYKSAHHLYPKGNRIFACLDQTKVKTWTGKFGIAHFLKDIFRPYIINELNAIIEEKNKSRYETHPKMTHNELECYNRVLGGSD